MTTPAPELSPGTVIDGHTIGAKVRARSGAATYAATDASGADVQLTVYAAACFPSTLVRERSLRELRQLQKVSAPEVVGVVACGKLDDGGLYEVNEVVEGPSLAELGKLERTEVGVTMAAVGRGLLAAQKGGVIHRNLGSNVAFQTAGGVKLLGFTVGEPQGGSAYGSIDSIAPEQVNGKVVDQRTLIYNLAAMTHQLLTGAPLFAGTAAEKLDLHANREASGADASLKRGLSKDPRMRPMMLKQFLAEFDKLAGGAAAISSAAKRPAPAPGAKPSTRGWTMFMEAQEAGGDAAGPGAAAAAPTAAAAAPSPAAAAPSPASPSPASTPAPSQPAAPAGAKPSTRGWTMFMEAEEASPSAEANPSPAAAPSPTPAASTPAPAPSSPTPAPSSPTPAPSAPAGAKPSTRGWTMFMEADEGASDASAAAPASPAAASPAAPSPAAPSQPATPSQPAAPAGAKPSTRGWTMFMEAEEGAPSQPSAAAAPAPSTAAPAPSTPAATPPPSSPAPASPAPAQPAAPAGAKPSTRGWTMFMEAETPEPATPDAPAPAPAGPEQAAQPAPAQPAQPAPAQPAQPTGGAPSTRGWTMFMEAEVPAGGEGQPGQPPASSPAPAEPAAPADPAPAVGASDAKGWTVFMEKEPLSPPAEQQRSAELAVTLEQQAQAPASDAPGPQEMATSELPAQAPGEQPAPGKKTVLMDEAPVVPAPGEQPQPGPSGAGPTDAAPSPAPAQPSPTPASNVPAPAPAAHITPTQQSNRGMIIGIVVVIAVIVGVILLGVL